jgi:hypothetical protein
MGTEVCGTMSILKDEDLIVNSPWALGVPAPARVLPALQQGCCLCGEDEGEPVAVGEDFDDHGPRGDSFIVLHCTACGVAYLGRRSSDDVRAPSDALRTDARDVLRHRGTRKLLRRELRRDSLPERVLVVGDAAAASTVATMLYGDRFPAGDAFEHIDPSSTGGRIDPRGAHYDVAVVIGEAERLPDPVQALATLRLQGCTRLVLVMDNFDARSCRLFRGRHWVGYDFPRKLYWFEPRAVRALVKRAGFEVESLGTASAPDRWTRSTHRFLRDWGAPSWLANRFAGPASVASVFASALEAFATLGGAGSVLVASCRSSANEPTPLGA